MERLSNTIRTVQRSYMPATQRTPQTEQQNTRPNHLNYPSESYYTRSAPLSRLPENAEERWEASAPSRSPLSRANYNGQRTTPRSVSNYRSQQPQDDYYEEEEHSTVISADVQGDWDDDTADMRYGDWEDELDYTSASQYPERDDYAASASHPGSATHQSTPEISAAAQRLAQVHTRNEPHASREPYRTLLDKAYSADVREGREVYRRTTDTLRPAMQREARLPMPASSSPLTPTPPARSTQRHTQPLKPQYTRFVPSEMRKQREQLGTLPNTPRETNADYTITVNSAPPPPKPPVCAICHGAGYLRSDVAFGHPQFGKPVACKCKELERKRKRRQQLQELSNLGAFAAKRFDTFTPQAGLQEAQQRASEFAKDPRGWLLFIGPNGCGKTHLAAAIANSCLEAGAVVLFSTVPDLLDHLRAAFAPESTEVYDQLFARMREAEVLVLDDLGTQQSSPWANEKLFQLLNYRYNSGFPTVITANLKGFQATDERIRSRLGDTSLVITLNLDHARDYRPRNPRRDY